ncbi:hypothetical protein UlMin_035941 [Ulmus minor]
MDPDYQLQHFMHDHEWVVNISRILEKSLEEKEEAIEAAVSIFSVPKTLLLAKPEAYVPQMVALGPYHHRRPELFEMERYKLNSAKRVQRNFKQSKISNLVQTFKEKECHIRGYYHRFLEFDKETLAWIFAIDASFLLEYLQVYSAKRESESSISSRLATTYSMDETKRKTTRKAILRDIIMLENQIPLFLLKEVQMLYHHQQEDHSDQALASMLLGFCKALCPIKYVKDEQSFKEECFTKSHLLDLLYSMIVPKFPLMDQIQSHPKIEKDKANNKDYDNNNFGSLSTKTLKSILMMFWHIISLPIFLLQKIFKSRTIMLILMVPYKFLLLFRNIREASVSKFISSAEEVAEGMGSVCGQKEESPLIEEISIPSVSDLTEIGVQFIPTNGGLETISFDKSSGKFYLPVVDLDENSEVVLRNLVAYEASISPEAMVFTRYTELMNGIIDSEEDVRILRKCGIVLNRLKSDQEVANLWNGLTKSVSITKVWILDKAIEDTNCYYSMSWKVKMKEKVKRCLSSSWPMLAFIAANLLLLLSAVQAGCSMYNCSKWLQNDLTSD